jgi:hypothetical protein
VSNRVHLAIFHSFKNAQRSASPSLERFLIHVFLAAHASIW